MTQNQRWRTYLHGVLHARVVEGDDVEAERLFGNAFNQHQVWALKTRRPNIETRTLLINATTKSAKQFVVFKCLSRHMRINGAPVWTLWPTGRHLLSSWWWWEPSQTDTGAALPWRRASGSHPVSRKKNTWHNRTSIDTFCRISVCQWSRQVRSRHWSLEHMHDVIHICDLCTVAWVYLGIIL